eukprot:g4954.t1
MSEESGKKAPVLCSGCKQAVGRGVKYVQVGEATMHPACFTCGFCEAELYGKKFYKNPADDKFICEACGAEIQAGRTPAKKGAAAAAPASTAPAAAAGGAG